MRKEKYSVISGSGSYIPTTKITNKDFLDHVFFDSTGIKLQKSNHEIINQFQHITGIEERRYVTDEQSTSDIAYLAATDALVSANTDPETLDYIIVAHNFGDISKDNSRSEFVPSIASRVKNRLQINNPNTIVYDIIFGCAGWLQAIIQSNFYIRSGSAKKILVIGAETLSRIADPNDRDSMIYADGAGAVILEVCESEQPIGIVSHHTQSFTNELAYVLKMGKSNNPDYKASNLFLKMQGRLLYEHALKIVPGIIKKSIEMAELSIESIDKLLIHQANNKMDEAILKRLFEEYNIKEIPNNIMPMTISWLGNSSVATLPTLYDLLVKNKIENYKLKKGSNIVFASIGAGVNVNSVVYKIPE
jgi:3-oxoacyl-[acyl-carrier-protein] synthase-3